MLFNVFWVSADFCGNCDKYFAGVYEADSLEAALQEFPPSGGLCGYEIHPLVTMTAEEIHTLRKRKTKPGSRVEWR